MPRFTDPADIAQNLFEFLAIEGFGLTAQRKNEILARVRGHASRETAARYDAKAKQFFVMLFSLKDLTPTSFKLADTLSRLPLGEFTSRAEANALAEQAAVHRNVPIIVCDGNFENVAMFDEPRLETEQGYVLLEALGEVLNADAAQADQTMAEDFSLVEPYLCCIREAVQYALGYAERCGPTDETTSRLLVLVRNDVVYWRIYE